MLALLMAVLLVHMIKLPDKHKHSFIIQYG